MNIKKLFSCFCLLGLSLSVLLAMYCYRYLNMPLTLPAQGAEFTVEKGSSLSSVNRKLQEKSWLQKGRVLEAYARIVGKTSIKAGEYELASGLTPLQLLDLLLSGDVKSYQVTLLEGWTFEQALTHLHSQEKLKIELSDKDRVRQLKGWGFEITHPEGWFFPDTYQYVLGDSDRSILSRAHKRMQAVLEEQWQQRSQNLPYKNAYEALIMASIVERESGSAAEQGDIAGVFVRRLNLKMRLQTDPTVIYGLGDEFDGDLRRRHLKQPSPYNTYVIKGLPPTPIALPGESAIKAAMNPLDGTALYFVAKGDGSHQFSASLEEHNRAVRDYQIERRSKNYRSSPQPGNP